MSMTEIVRMRLTQTGCGNGRVHATPHVCTAWTAGGRARRGGKRAGAGAGGAGACTYNDAPVSVCVYVCTMCVCVCVCVCGRDHIVRSFCPQLCGLYKVHRVFSPLCVACSLAMAVPRRVATVHAHVHAYVHSFACTCCGSCTHSHSHTHSHTHTHKHTLTHTHTHTHSLTHTHTHEHTWNRGNEGR